MPRLKSLYPRGCDDNQPQGTTIMPEYRLGSAPMVNTPGLLTWAINGYKFKRDRKKLLNVFTSAWSNADNPKNPSKETFDKLLKQEIPYTVVDDAVVFNA